MKKIIFCIFPIIFFIMSCDNLDAKKNNKVTNNNQSKIIDYSKTYTLTGTQTSTNTEVNCTCIEIYRPVCGSDGKTYGNDCWANCYKVDSFQDGECPPIQN